MAITETWLKANHKKVRVQAMERADRDGLGVRLSPKGKITFQMRYLYVGEARRLDLGSYPLMSLKAAREENQRLRAGLEQGHDPKIVRRTEKQAIQNADLIEPLFRTWHEKVCKQRKKGAREILRSFEIYVFPEIGDLPAEKVTMHEWLTLLESVAQRVPAIADRILTNAKQFLKWCKKRRLLSANPLVEITAKEDLDITKGRETRSLSDEEIKRVWRGIERSRMAAKNRLFMLLCLVYGCRNGELRLAEKTHFDLERKVWCVPPENHKLGKLTREPLLRPITPEIEALIRQAMALSSEDSKYPFTCVGSDRPMKHTVLVHMPYNIMQYLRRYENYEMEHWSVHDLRKTARTNFSTLTQPHIAEIMLGHKLPGSWEIYDHYDYLPEQAQAYSAWWQRLARLIAESRAEMPCTRRTYDPRQNLVLPGLAGPEPARTSEAVPAFEQRSEIHESDEPSDSAAS